MWHFSFIFQEEFRHFSLHIWHEIPYYLPYIKLTLIISLKNALSSLFLPFTAPGRRDEHTFLTLYTSPAGARRPEATTAGGARGLQYTPVFYCHFNTIMERALSYFHNLELTPQ